MKMRDFKVEKGASWLGKWFLFASALRGLGCNRRASTIAFLSENIIGKI